MSGGHHIRAVGAASGDGGAQPHDTADELLVTEDMVFEPIDWDADWSEPAPQRNKRWLAPAVALGVVAGWTGFFAWASGPAMLGGAAPSQWVEWIVQWSVPVLLVAALWLLIQRNGTREAGRYAEAASALSQESERLERRLTTVNRELSLAREFLATQGRELESFGRIAGERLSEHADRLRSLVHTNSSQIEQIADVSATALENMDRLRSDLPVIANSARDVANQIGNAGGTAEGQIERLVHGFERLNQFGSASERQVDALSARVEDTVAAFEAQAAKMEDITVARFAALREKSDAFRGELDSREVESLAALRRRADQLAEEVGATRLTLDEQEEEALRSMRARLTGLRTESETVARAIREGEEEAKSLWIAQIAAMKDRLSEAVEQIRTIDEQALAMAGKKLQALREEAMEVDAKLAERNALFQTQIEERRVLFETGEREAMIALQDQLAAIDSELETRRTRQSEQTRELQASSTAAAGEIAALTSRIEALVRDNSASQQALSATTSAVARDLAQSRDELASARAQVTDMTDACVRLLELIQASAQHSKTDLPEAIGRAEERLLEARRSGEQLGVMLGETLTRSEAISNYVIAANRDSAALDTRTDELQQGLRRLRTSFESELGALRDMIGQLEQDGERVSEQTGTSLRSAIEALETRVREAMLVAARDSSGAIDDIAAGIGARAAGAINRAVRDQSSQAIAQLDEAAARSSSSAREAAIQLRDQLALVNELTGNLENRVALARSRAEEQVDNDFARRVALITEALNSNAIDIAKSLSTDVTDTAWASYLRGDRGIFTRRAVSLLSSTEAREIAELYDADMDFRDHVSRYIHDFEAMLRTMLSTRDGNALGVTLLSSDMGKLYVALAQAIERLRTE